LLTYREFDIRIVKHKHCPASPKSSPKERTLASQEQNLN
jgi:hypothetical protein